MPRIINFCLMIGLYLLSLSLYAGDLGSVDGHALVFEKGDIISYQGKEGITFTYGHNGIFYEWPITEADSHDSSQYATIEALGYEFPVGKRDIANFLERGRAFWGVYKNANLTYLQRNKIVDTAKNQFGVKYSVIKIKRPREIYGDKASFRCDGLVEYCYEQVGVDLVQRDAAWPQWPWETLISPLKQIQSSHLAERTSASVETVELERVLQNGEPIEPDENDIYYVYDRPITDIVTIEANVSDGDYGSGIRMTDFWIGAPDDTPDVFESNDSGKRIGIDNHPTTVGGIYKADWDIDDFEPGEYIIHVLAYDQAGNMKNIEIKMWKRLEIVPNWTLIREIRLGRVEYSVSPEYSFNKAKEDWNKNDWYFTYLVGVDVRFGWLDYALRYYVVIGRGKPHTDLTAYNPDQYRAEVWYQITKGGPIYAVFDAHNSGYTENKWYKYPEDPVVGTIWTGTQWIPPVNNPPNWNCYHGPEEGKIGWVAGDWKFLLLPK